MSMDGQSLHLPGGVQLQQPSPEQQLLIQIAQTIDALLQLQARIAMGWNPSEAVRDMGMRVPEPPNPADPAMTQWPDGSKAP
jgi:hypothetical protein